MSLEEGMAKLELNTPESVGEMIKSTLESIKCADIKSTSSKVPQPMFLEEEQAPAEAFHKMANMSVRACPVRSGAGPELIGTLDLRDTVKFFVEESKRENKTPKDDASFDPNLKLMGWEKSEAIKGILHHPEVKKAEKSLKYLAKMRPFQVFAPEDSLVQVASALAHGKHIVGISGGPPETAGLSKIITQRMLFQALAQSLQKVKMTVEEIMTSPVHTIPCTATAFDGFNLMATKDVSGVAVVDEDGCIIHNMSSKDMKLWVAHKEVAKGVQEASVEDFLSAVRRDGPKEKTRVPVCTCHKTDTIGHVAGMLASTGYHHMWVVEDKHPIGVISLTDIFKRLLK